MAIDFAALAAPKDAIVPVLSNTFLFNRKKFHVANFGDGWHVVRITGNAAIGVEPYVFSGDEKGVDWALGYTYQNQLIHMSQDAARRKWQMSVSVPLHFNAVETFSAIRAVVWEDGRAYYALPNYADAKTDEIKAAFDADRSLKEVKGITPEHRILYLFHDLERQQLREMLKAQEEQRRHEEMLRSVPGRLAVTLARAGGELLSWSRSGHRIIFEWKLADGDFKYNSVIDANTWKVLEAGYCMSGSDHKMNLTSLAKTAEEYESRGVVFITRH